MRSFSTVVGDRRASPARNRSRVPRALSKNLMLMSRRTVALGGVALAIAVLATTALAAEAAPEAANASAAITVALEHAVKIVTLVLARLVEMFAGLIIGVASLKAIVSYFRGFALGGTTVPHAEARLGLGRSLALALELELGADILGTAVAPTWNDIGQLAAIAVLRTALNYSLERELRAEHDQPSVHAPVPAA